MKKPKPLLWLSDSRGIFAPRDFAKSFDDRDKRVANVFPAEWQVLEDGPDHEHYWEVWDDVMRDAVVTDERGNRYRIWQDSDVWLIPMGMEWDDRVGAYVWPEEEDV